MFLVKNSTANNFPPIQKKMDAKNYAKNVSMKNSPGTNIKQYLKIAQIVE
jgi:hypothetical protein